jgi:hypothetical protein
MPFYARFDWTLRMGSLSTLPDVLNTALVALHIQNLV